MIHLEVQAEFGGTLITNEELDLIHKTWSTDLQQDERLANA